MKIIVDINHPGHVHFFKYFIWEMQKNGCEVLITASKKEITYDLLDCYGFDYVKMGGFGDSILRKIISVPRMDYNMYKVVKEFQPDMLLGLASFRIAHSGFLLRKDSINFDDTEHARGELHLYLPFVNCVCTPSCYANNLGKKQIRYNGYHELAYLHPKHFIPNSEVLSEIGLLNGQKFFIVRFVSWEAVHDIGEKGFTYDGKKRLVELLRKHGRVIITSESSLPPEFEPYRMSISPTKIHDLLYYAAMYVGEGGTMASEAAVLGTPSIYVNTLKMGYLQELEAKYGLIYMLEDPNKAIKKVDELLTCTNLKEQWIIKRQTMLRDKIDVTAWMINLVENYSEHTMILNGYGSV